MWDANQLEKGIRAMKRDKDRSPRLPLEAVERLKKHGVRNSKKLYSRKAAQSEAQAIMQEAA